MQEPTQQVLEARNLVAFSLEDPGESIHSASPLAAAVAAAAAVFAYGTYPLQTSFLPSEGAIVDGHSAAAVASPADAVPGAPLALAAPARTLAESPFQSNLNDPVASPQDA